MIAAAGAADEAARVVDRLDEKDVKALARFAVIALAVLPFLPSGRFGPYGAWNPQKLWWVVVLVTGFSFAGYVANRIFGARHGTIATAIIGGAYSSTAVTQSLAQRLGSERGRRRRAGRHRARQRGHVPARAWSSSRSSPAGVLVDFALIIAAGAAGRPRRPAGGFTARRRATRGRRRRATRSRWCRRSAFVLFVAAAAVAARWAQGRFGEQGIAVLLLIMGSMDVDAAIVTAGGLAAGGDLRRRSPRSRSAGRSSPTWRSSSASRSLTPGRRADRRRIALGASMAVLVVAIGFAFIRL